MRILLDHNAPAPLRYSFRGHQVETAYERGWAELSNGELLAAAESHGFDLLITTDRNIRYQQNLSGRRLALLALNTNDWTRLRKHTGIIVSALSGIEAGSYMEIEIPFR